jgi:5-methylcytosine-specific restriction endonuclease McrBC regulatory subunit McrC
VRCRLNVTHQSTVHAARPDRLDLNLEGSKRAVSQTDVYLMIAYGRLYECRHLMMLYPHHAALREDAFAQSYAATCRDHYLHWQRWI